MAVSNVYGLAHFREHMSGLEDSYAIIGGTACDLILRDADLPFRSTKDIDVVLVIDEGSSNVGQAIWDLVREGGYTLGHNGTGKTCFYRFTKPANPGFPAMIEFFCAKPEFELAMTESTIVPMPLNEDISSLSAILLDDDYYAFLKSGRTIIDGLCVVDALHLVPFKARAFLDLTKRRANGEHVDSKDIRKHRNDVFRLVQLFNEETSLDLPDSIGKDMKRFLDAMRNETIPFKQLGIHMTLDEALSLISRSYRL